MTAQMATLRSFKHKKRKVSIVTNSGILWFKCNTDFLLKNQDDATSGLENKYQISASSLISFSWKKKLDLIQKPSLNGLSISGAKNFLRQRLPKK